MFFFWKCLIVQGSLENRHLRRRRPRYLLHHRQGVSLTFMAERKHAPFRAFVYSQTPGGVRLD